VRVKRRAPVKGIREDLLHFFLGAPWRCWSRSLK
jgi:hypothetical protein